MTSMTSLPRLRALLVLVAWFAVHGAPLVSDAATFVGSASSPNAPLVELEITLDDVAGEATLVFRGPDDRWFGWAFGTTTMQGYSIILEHDPAPGAIHERSLGGTGDPGVMQATQDLIVQSQETSAGVKEVTVTRALNTGDANDYVFPAFDGATVDLIWSRGNASDLTMAYHGPLNKGSIGMALGADATSTPSKAFRSWGSIKVMFRRVDE